MKNLFFYFLIFRRISQRFHHFSRNRLNRDFSLTIAVKIMVFINVGRTTAETSQNFLITKKIPIFKIFLISKVCYRNKKILKIRKNLENSKKSWKFEKILKIRTNLENSKKSWKFEKILKIRKNLENSKKYWF